MLFPDILYPLRNTDFADEGLWITLHAAFHPFFSDLKAEFAGEFGLVRHRAGLDRHHSS